MNSQIICTKIFIKLFLQDKKWERFQKQQKYILQQKNVVAGKNLPYVLCIERRGYKNQIDKCSDKKNFLGGPIDGAMNNGISSAGTVGHNNVGGDESESQVANDNPQVDVPD